MTDKWRTLRLKVKHLAKYEAGESQVEIGKNRIINQQRYTAHTATDKCSEIWSCLAAWYVVCMEKQTVSEGKMAIVQALRRLWLQFPFEFWSFRCLLYLSNWSVHVHINHRYLPSARIIGAIDNLAMHGNWAIEDTYAQLPLFKRTIGTD